MKNSILFILAFCFAHNALAESVRCVIEIHGQKKQISLELTEDNDAKEIVGPIEISILKESIFSRSAYGEFLNDVACGANPLSLFDSDCRKSNQFELKLFVTSVFFNTYLEPNEARTTIKVNSNESLYWKGRVPMTSDVSKMVQVTCGKSSFGFGGMGSSGNTNNDFGPRGN